MNILLCPHLILNRRQPITGFVTHDNEPAYYCVGCLIPRIEESLEANETPDEIAANLSFSNCGHVEDGTGTCGRCTKAVMAMLTYRSMCLHLKPVKDQKRLRRFDRLINTLVQQHGRISPDSIYTAQHGKAI